MGGNKFSAEVPKGDGWGVDRAVADAVQKIQRGEKSPLIPVVGVIDIKGLQIDPETHTVIATVRVRRLEALDSMERIRAAQKVLLEQAAARRGEGNMLPFEEQELINSAFGGLDADTLEQDERELEEDQTLSELDRLRKHMTAVHGADSEEIDALNDVEVRDRHHSEHEDDRAEGAISHDEDWWEWRRIVISEAMTDDEVEDAGELSPEHQADTDTDADTVPDSPASLFDDGQGGEGGAILTALDDEADDEAEGRG